MHTKYIEKLKEQYSNWKEIEGNIYKFRIKSEVVIIDLNVNKWEIKNFDSKRCGNLRIYDLDKEENWSVVALIFSLFNKGYTKDEIFLEKTWPTGHGTSGSIDVVIYNGDESWYFFKVKSIKEINKYTSLEYEKETKQFFTCLYQEKMAKVGTYYTYNFLSNEPLFFNIFITKSLKDSFSADNMYERWNKQWDMSKFILDNTKFDIRINPIIYKDLKIINDNDLKKIFNQFLTILRQHSVSDKNNAFDKMINIFIAKVFDELQEDTDFNINGNDIHGVRFQYIHNIDDNISFLKRLNDLYKNGMEQYMQKDIIDYTDDDIERIIGLNNATDKLRNIIDDLRLKKNNAFSFIEVFDDDTFEQNNIILKELVLLLQNYKFKYNNKHQFLGDFFEELLNTSWKQEAGQFFTPMPVVNFMINSLPINRTLINNIEHKNNEFIPKMIDFASGSGHFIVAYMQHMQELINKLDINSTQTINNKIASYKTNPFSWANNSVVGIEKDYRLSKTTKISTFLNGDGDATIINGDGINKFNCKEYMNTILYTSNTTNNVFDFVIGNPPYSVQGFMKNIRKNNVGIDDFELLKNMKDTASEIEILFVERTNQLLKENGLASLVLPRSVLTSSKYSDMRDYIFNNFKIISIFESGDITFSGTTTSPIILFLEKKSNQEKNYNVLVINSPKMVFESNNNEKKFLGYEFSSNRNKLGIKILNNNLVENYASLVKEFFITGNVKNLNQYSFINNISNMLVEDKNGIKNLIYTRNKQHGSDFVRLGSYIDKINPKYDSKDLQNENINKSELKYVEIGDLNKGFIKIKHSKNKDSSRIAKRGDILFSSFATNNKIAICEQEYKVSQAIYVLRINDTNKRNYVYNYLLNNTNNIIDDMKVFLDGFKITYAKINEFNLLNNIYIKENK